MRSDYFVTQYRILTETTPCILYAQLLTIFYIVTCKELFGVFASTFECGAWGEGILHMSCSSLARQGRQETWVTLVWSAHSTNTQPHNPAVNVTFLAGHSKVKKL